MDLELVELLGTGGFGEVWKARNPYLASAEPVALKFCLDGQAAKLLRHEAAVLDRVMRHGRHPGIVQLRHTYLSADPPCLEYEFVRGGDLAGLIQEGNQAKKGPTAAQAARVVARLAEVIGFAHSQVPPIVHRDLKPANVLVQTSPDGKLRLRVADFGIGGLATSQAAILSRSGLSKGGMAATMVRGAYTPLYASPQQMRGEPADPRDDIYALGVSWYQLLTGDLGTGAPSGLQWPKQLIQQGVPEAQVQLLAACVEPRSEDRPATAAELAKQLKQASAVASGDLRGETSAPAREGGLPPDAPWWQQTASTPRAAVPVPGINHSVPAAREPPVAIPVPGSPAGATRNPGSAHRVRLQSLLRELLREHRRVARARPRWFYLAMAGLLSVPIGLLSGALVATLLSDVEGAGYPLLSHLLAVLVGAAFAVLPFILLLRFRGHLLCSGRAGIQGLTRVIADQYPQEVAEWGGEVVLDNIATVKELIRSLAARAPATV